MIPLEHIELSDDYHFRAEDDEDTIENYTDILRQYCDDLEEDQSATYPFPPIVVLNENDDDVYYVISGRHRFQAAENAGIDEMACIVLTDRIQAIQKGLKSNRQHGLRLNNADMAHCIKLALDELNWSSRKIADLVGCSRQYVDKIKKERPSSRDTVIGKDGKEYPTGGECKKTKKGITEGDVLDITGEIALSKTPSNQNDNIVDELKEALILPMDTQKRSDAIFDVFVKIVDVCFKNTQVRRDFLQKFQVESSEYGVKPLEPQGSYNDAA
jgi:hypothetical protein